MDGNLGLVGLALMTSTTSLPAAPTITLGVKQFADPMPQFIETDEDIATGTRFGRQKTVQGVQSGNKSIQARGTLRDLPTLLTALLGTPNASTGLITPRAQDYGALMPGQPVAVWQKHPLMNSLFPAAQIGGLTITVSNRQTAEVNVTLNTARTEDLGTLPTFPPVAATGLLKFMNWYVLIDGKKYAPESGSIEIMQNMTAEDGAQGLDDDKRMYIIGWSANGPLTAKLSCVLSEVRAGVGGGSLPGLIALAKPDLSTGERTQKAVETGFDVGDRVIKFNFPTAELRTTNIPNGLGRLAVTFEAEGVGLGAPPLTATVPVVTP